MIIGIGTDITDVARIESSVNQYGERFLRRIFTETEREYCERREKTKYRHYAARFAAKEAFSKAIGTGVTQGFAFNLIGICNEPGGKPTVELFGIMAERWSDCRINVSLSHTDDLAVAVVTIER
ncbi:holo-ACP synthase [Ignavibacteria bacterium]|nr:holo-ACP synthase [Bacteroidota bacterium]MCZ2133119.1 holo-ACP synthase [Bacteroidota bacterium]